MTVTFEVLNTEANIRRVQLTRTAVIGRCHDCGLRIASARVSRRHCEVLLNDDGVRIRDLGSSNGTFVNNQQLVPGVVFELEPDDEVRLGSVRLRAEFQAVTVDRPVLQGDAPSEGLMDSKPTGAMAAAISAASAAEAVTVGEITPQIDRTIGGETLAADSALTLPRSLDQAAEFDDDDSVLEGPVGDDHESNESLSNDANSNDSSESLNFDALEVNSDEDIDDDSVLDFLNNLD